MPLAKSSSKEAFKSNLKAEISAGKPRQQALAIAYDAQRRNRATGGRVAGLGGINHAPTEAQKEAGNYRKAHTSVHGLDITIENARGSQRTGVDRGGKPWSVTMPDHYGYIKRTEGSDGDHVDCYIGNSPKSDKVYIVDQIDAETGKFDEHKCMLGFPDQKAAVSAYHSAFSDGKGKDRIGSVTELSVDRFKDWLKSGQTKKPMSNGTAATPIKRAAGGRLPHFVKRYADGGTTSFETQLSPEREGSFQKWKSANAPNDTGVDYDLRGAFNAGLSPATNGHWPDTFKKPNHPTFSVESIYAKDAPDRAGQWDGDIYLSPNVGRDGPQATGAAMAAGGQVPWFVRQQASHLNHVGPIRSVSPGRADKIGLRVPSGSYVLPSAAVSHLGQNNTESGFHVADKMFRVAPTPKMRAAGGAATVDDPGTEIMISGGEYVLHPDKVREIGGGDLDQGHKALDIFVKGLLKQNAKEAASLPPPAKD